MLKILRQFLLATSYVTSLPVSLFLDAAQSKASTEDGEISVIEDDLSGLAVYLSLVGLLIGFLLCCFANFLIAVNAPDIVRGTLLTIGWLCLTNGIHFDGLLDTADGIFSHRDQARTIEIMADPRAGNFAVMVGLSTIMVKASSLAAIPPSSLPAVLLLTPAWSRWSETYAIGKYSYLKQIGKGKIWHDTIRFPGDLYIGIMAPFTVLVCLAASGAAGSFSISIFTVGMGISIAAWLNNKLGGHTGDTYGAVVELSESTALMIFMLGHYCLVR